MISSILLSIAAFLCLLAAAIFLYRSMYKKVQQGEALVVSNAKSCNVYFGSTFVAPFLYETKLLDLRLTPLEVAFGEEEELFSRDEVQLRVRIVFSLYIEAKERKVLKVVRCLHTEQLSDPKHLSELFNLKFSLAVRAVARSFSFEELRADRMIIREQLAALLENTLYGFSLGDVYVRDICAVSIEEVPEDTKREEETKDSEDTEPPVPDSQGIAMSDIQESFEESVQRIHEGILKDLEEASKQNSIFTARLHERIERSKAFREEDLSSEYQEQDDTAEIRLSAIEKFVPGEELQASKVAEVPQVWEELQAWEESQAKEASQVWEESHVWQASKVAEAPQVWEEPQVVAEAPQAWEEPLVEDIVLPPVQEELTLAQTGVKVAKERSEVRVGSRFSRFSIPPAHTFVTMAAGPLLALALFFIRGGFEVNVGVFSLLLACSVSILFLCGVRLVAWRRGYESPSVALFLAAAGFLFWSWPWRGIPVITSFVLWVALTMLLGSLLVWVLAKKDGIFLNRSGYVGASFACLLLLVSAFRSIDIPDFGSDAVPERLAFVAEAPNVYVLNVEGFSRLDIMQEQFSVDGWGRLGISEKVTDLGFVLDENATSNYAETVLSADASLNASLPVSDSPGLLSARAANSAVLRGQNQFVEWFTGNGYEYWHAESGLFEASSCDENIADECFSSESSSSFLDLTPFRSKYGSVSSFGLGNRLTVPAYTSWAKTAKSSEKPVLVFGHIVDPHPPYEASCAPGWKGETEGSLNAGWDPQWRDDYVKQSECLLDEIEEAVEEIVAADPTAVIIVQSNYGAAFGIDWSKPLAQWTTKDVWQRFAVFRGMRLPENCTAVEDRESSSLVNTLPLLQSCLTGDAPVWVTPESFLTRYGAETVEPIKNLEEGVLSRLCDSSLSFDEGCMFL